MQVPHGLSYGPAQLDDIQKKQPGRFQLRKLCCVCKGGLHAGSPYLNSSVGINAKCILDLLHLMAAAMDSISGPWAIGGDWNCTPEQLAATG